MIGTSATLERGCLLPMRSVACTECRISRSGSSEAKAFSREDRRDSEWRGYACLPSLESEESRARCLPSAIAVGSNALNDERRRSVLALSCVLLLRNDSIGSLSSRRDVVLYETRRGGSELRGGES